MLKLKVKQLTAVVALLLVSISLTACGGNEKKDTVPPGKESKVKIDGKEYDAKTTEDGGAVIKVDE